MTTNISIKELKARLNTRLLLDKLSPSTKIKEQFYYEELVSNTAYAANELFRELGLDDIWARKRGQRVFVMHEHYRRIICEIGVVAEKLPNGLYRRPEITIVTLKGIVSNNSTLQDLIESVAKLGIRTNFKRKETK